MSLHPGVVRTEIMRYTNDGLGYLGRILGVLTVMFYPIWIIFSKTTEQGAQTTIYCAGNSKTFLNSLKIFKKLTNIKIDSSFV